MTQIQQQKTRTFYEVAVPNRYFDYRADLGGQGDTFTVNGWLQSADQTAKEQISALVGTTGILDLQEPTYKPFDGVYYYQTSPAWTNNTTPAYVLGTPFTLLANGGDLMYFGFHNRWNLMQFIFWAFGNCSNVYWEYSQGSGSWNLLSGYTDNTNGFSQNGAFSFTPPPDWAQDTIDVTGFDPTGFNPSGFEAGYGSLFWLRVGALSITAAATINQVLMNPCYQCILQNPLYTFDPTVWDYVAYQLTLQQVENPFTPTLAAAGFDPLGFSTGFNT